MKKLTVVFSVYSTRLPNQFKPKGAVVIPSIAKLQLDLLQEATNVVSIFNMANQEAHHVFHIFNQLSLLRIWRHMIHSYKDKKLNPIEVELWVEWEEKKFIQIRIDSQGDFIDNIPDEIYGLPLKELFNK